MPDALINGVQHHWEDQGSGEPILLFHGAVASSVSLADLVRDLATTHRAIAVDMRSMGRSAHVTELPPSAWIDDAVALLAHLGLRRVHVHGVSLGARVALRLAIDHPELVRSLMLEQPIIAMEGNTNQQLNANIGGFDQLPAAEQQQRAAQHGDDWRDVMTNYMAIRNRPELQEHYNLRATAGQVTVPTLIFRSDEREVVHPLGHAFELHQQIAGSWLWICPNSQGAPTRSNPAEAVALMRRLMATAP